MVPVRYPGLSNPQKAFDELRPFHRAIIDMQRTYRPSSPSYRALAELLVMLDVAAYTVTGEARFFMPRVEPSGGWTGRVK
jgi:hypothetical protein